MAKPVVFPCPTCNRKGLIRNMANLGRFEDCPNCVKQGFCPKCGEETMTNKVLERCPKCGSVGV